MCRNHLLASLLFLCLTCGYAIADYNQGYLQGTQDGKALSGELNTMEKVNQRVSQPLTDNNSTMTTFGANTVAPTSGTNCPDGYIFNVGSGLCDKQQFTGQLIAPSSDIFVELTLAFTANNDVSILMLAQDTDYDQAFDYTYAPAILISGICVNGVISCTAGTWENCSYYLWTVGMANGAELSATASINNLTGCYCINNSCNNPLAGNLERALEDLGGGILGAIQWANQKISITRIETLSDTIRYYGQLTSESGSNYSAPPNASYYNGSFDPSTYYNPSVDTLSGPGTAMAANQSIEPTSLYSLAMRANDNVADSQQVKKCVIDRVVKVDITDTAIQYVTDTCSTLDTTGCTLYEEQICNYGKSECVKSVEYSTATGLVPLNNTTQAQSPLTLDIWTFDADGGQITYIQPPATNGVLSAGADHWWNISRDYVCDAPQDINTKYAPVVDPAPTFIASEQVERTKHVRDNTDYSGGNIITYEDLDPATGLTTTHTIQLQPNGSLDPCEKACKVQVATQNTQANLYGNASEYQVSTASYFISYETCVDDVCPLEPGDVLIQDCICLNEFPQAAAMIKLTTEIGKDITCSAN